jgi:diguanylate cyclase (GGDEF)-like protein
LYNRRHIFARFHEEFEKTTRLGKSLSCIIADIDHFKTVNDQYGHLTGDSVLKEVAHRIRQSIRVYDILGRYGGEEFLIILPETDIEQAWHFAERTRMQVKESPIMDNVITISLGVTCLQEGDQTIDDMIKRADDVLYKAKNAGRDRVEWKLQS